MISETQEEQASLYALGLLDAGEADAFERELEANPELQELVRELREAAAMLAWTLPDTDKAPAALRNRIRQSLEPVVAPSVTPFRRETASWLPWAIAALFMIGCGWLGWQLATERQAAAAQLAQANEVSPAIALTKVAFCDLEPTPDFAKQVHAEAWWDATQRRGVLRVDKLPPVAPGKDYQLWTVQAGHKDTVNAGVLHVDANGSASVPFEANSKDAVQAVAISLEKAGGAERNEGPVLLVGKF